MKKYFLMRDDPVSCGYCTNISKSDSDIDSDLALGRLLLSDQSLSAGMKEYVKSEFVLWVEPKSYDMPMLDYYSVGIYHILSKQFMNVLSACDVKAEYVPIQFFDNTNNSAGKYYLAHFLTMISCADKERSTDTRRPYEPGYNVIAIKESMIPEDVLLFREKDKFKSKLFVSNSLMNEIEAANIKGLLFIPLPADGWETGQLIKKLEEKCKKSTPGIVE